MEAIYRQGLEPKSQGKPMRPFYEETRLVDFGLNHVPELAAKIDRHGL